MHVHRLTYARRLLLLSKAIVLVLTGPGIVLGVVGIGWIGIAAGMLLLVGAAVGLHLESWKIIIKLLNSKLPVRPMLNFVLSKSYSLTGFWGFGVLGFCEL